jgi:hypothetical protein
LLVIYQLHLQAREGAKNIHYLAGEGEIKRRQGGKIRGDTRRIHSHFPEVKVAVHKKE